MKKYISYSLWGDNKVYTYGAVENIILAKEIYPGWIVRIHYNDTVPNNIIEWIKTQDNAELVNHHGKKSRASNMLWRFEDLFIEDSTIIIRDADSHLNIRERAAVDEWLESSKDFHIIRDHVHHTVPIMGCSFGCRNNACKYLYMPNNSNNYNLCPLNFLNGKDLLNKFINHINETNDKYMIDQIFLYRHVYPCVINNTFVHASHNKYEPFAKDFPVVDYNGFVGEIITKVPRASKIFNETCDDFERHESY